MIAFQQISSSLLASTTAIENIYKKTGVTPPQQRVAMFAQYLAAKTPTNNIAISGFTSADDVAAQAGYGSQAHLLALTYYAEAGANPAPLDWFPIADGTTAKAYTITFATNASSQGIWRVYILGKKYEISVANGDTPTVSAAALAALINADKTCPFTASPAVGVVTITANWKGLSSDLLDVRKNYYASDVNVIPSGQTMVIVSSVSGATDPSLTTALANMGNTFYTFVLTALNDATAAGALETAWTARIDPLVRKPFVGVMGYVDTRANFITALGSRNNPGSTYFPVEASPSHPGQIAAALVAVASSSAAADASRPWTDLVLQTILPGSGPDWTYPQAQAVEVAGGSTFQYVTGGKIKILDALTTYKTNAGGASDDSWRYPETITNTQYKLFSIDQMLSSSPFDRAKIIDDADVAAAEYAISPSTMKAYWHALFDNWGLLNHSKKIQAMKDSLIVEQDGANYGRLNVQFTDYMVAGLRVVAVQRNWSF